MDHKGLAALIVRTGGLVLVIYTVTFFPAQYGGFIQVPEPSFDTFLVLLLLPNGIPLAVGLLLMAFPGKISRVVTGPASEETALPEQLQSILFAGIGLFFATESVLTLVSYLIHLIFDDQSVARNISMSPKDQAIIATALAGMALGVLLMVGARTLSALLDRLKNANTTVRPPT